MEVRMWGIRGVKVAAYRAGSRRNLLVEIDQSDISAGETGEQRIVTGIHGNGGDGGLVDKLAQVTAAS